MTEEETKDLSRQLTELQSEHRDLDEIIERLSETGPYDQLQLKRLKKRKLILKDSIRKVQSRLLPDILA